MSTVWYWLQIGSFTLAASTSRNSSNLRSPFYLSRFPSTTGSGNTLPTTIIPRHPACDCLQTSTMLTSRTWFLSLFLYCTNVHLQLMTTRTINASPHRPITCDKPPSTTINHQHSNHQQRRGQQQMRREGLRLLRLEPHVCFFTFFWRLLMIFYG